MGQIPSSSFDSVENSSTLTKSTEGSQSADWVDLKDEAKVLMESEHSKKDKNEGKQREGLKDEDVDAMLTKEEAEKLRKTKQKYDQLKSMMANGMQIRPKRSQIWMTIPNCAKLFGQNEFKIFSEPIELFGFKWKLSASSKVNEGSDGWLGLYLHAYPPPGYSKAYCIEVNFCVRILNTLRGNDIQHELADKKYENGTGYTGWGFAQIAKFEDLLNKNNGFLQANGSIEADVEFTVKTATLDHILDEF